MTDPMKHPMTPRQNLPKRAFRSGHPLFVPPMNPPMKQNAAKSRSDLGQATASKTVSLQQIPSRCRPKLRTMAKFARAVLHMSTLRCRTWRKPRGEALGAPGAMAASASGDLPPAELQRHRDNDTALSVSSGDSNGADAGENAFFDELFPNRSPALHIPNSWQHEPPAAQKPPAKSPDEPPAAQPQPTPMHPDPEETQEADVCAGPEATGSSNLNRNMPDKLNVCAGAEVQGNSNLKKDMTEAEWNACVSYAAAHGLEPDAVALEDIKNSQSLSWSSAARLTC